MSVDKYDEGAREVVKAANDAGRLVGYDDLAAFGRRCAEEANGETLTVLAKIIDGFDQKIFVRNIEGDSDPAWAVKLFPYLAALGKAVALRDAALKDARTEGEK